MNYTIDPWNIGTPSLKSYSLGFYVIVNFLGIILNFILILSIIRSRDKTSRDIFIAGLSSGCFVMSLACAIQCLLNYSSSDHSYQHGDMACYFEAYFHVASIMVQFINIMMISWSSYKNVIKRQTISTDSSTVWMIGIWISQSLGIAILSRFSEVILMTNGAYCFFDFTSVIIVWWFTPVMLITLLSMIYFYYKIYKLAQDSNTLIKINGQDTNATNDNRTTSRVALRSLIFVGVYFIGWFPAIITCIYAIINGYVPELLDILLGNFGSLHSVFQPIAYGIYNKNLHKLIVCCFPSCGENLKLEIVQLRGRETVVTIDKPLTPINSRNPNLQIKRPSLLPGQAVNMTYLQESPTKLLNNLSPPKSPEKKSPSSNRKKWPSSDYRTIAVSTKN